MPDIPIIKKRKLTEDGRRKRLLQWREAFMALNKNNELHPKLKIVLYFESEFPLLYHELIKSKIALSPKYKVKILIIYLPEELKINYLAGCSWDRMFSNKGVAADVFYTNNPNELCHPESQKWEGFYEILWNYREKKIKGIPYIPRGVRRKTKTLLKAST